VNKRKISIIAAATATAAIAAGIGANTFANFTHTKTIEAKATAGTVFFDKFGPSSGGAKITVANVQPGDSTGPQTIVVKNGGTLKGTVALKLTPSGAEDGCAGGDTDGPEVLAEGVAAANAGPSCTDTITNKGDLLPNLTYVVKNGSATLFDSTVAPPAPTASLDLPAGTEVGLTVTVSVKHAPGHEDGAENDTDNIMQGDKASLTLTGTLTPAS
jgi:hypothetical protein